MSVTFERPKGWSTSTPRRSGDARGEELGGDDGDEWAQPLGNGHQPKEALSPAELRLVGEDEGCAAPAPDRLEKVLHRGPGGPGRRNGNERIAGLDDR